VVQRALDCCPRGVVVAEVPAGERVEQVGLDQSEVGIGGDAAVEDGLEFAAGTGGVALGEVDHCGGGTDLAPGGRPVVDGGEGGPRLFDVAEPGVGGDRPARDPGGERMLPDHARLYPDRRW
jgi:hypothetical protein